MNKIDIINEILNLYEENNNLKNEVEFLKNKQKSNKKEAENPEEKNSLEERIYKIGLNTLYENGFSGNYISKGWSDNKYPDIEEWSNNNIRLNEYEEISIKEFKDLFGDKIKNAYDKALEKAKERDKEEE